MVEKTSIVLDKFQFSSSKRKMGRTCWLKYYHQVVARTYPYSETPAMELGNYVDEVLEEAIATATEPDLDAITERIKHIMPDYRHTDSLVEGIDAGYEYAVTRTGIKVLQRRMALDNQCKPTAVDWRKKSKLFDSAMFDLITLSDVSECLVDDWKTGNPGFPDWNQIEDYALYMFATQPKVKRVIGSLVWLRNGRHPKDIVHKSTRSYERAELGKTIARWAEFYKDVLENNNNKDWPATYNQNLCPMCDHSEYCQTYADRGN